MISLTFAGAGSAAANEPLNRYRIWYHIIYHTKKTMISYTTRDIRKGPQSQPEWHHWAITATVMLNASSDIFARCTESRSKYQTLVTRSRFFVAFMLRIRATRLMCGFQVAMALARSRRVGREPWHQRVRVRRSARRLRTGRDSEADVALTRVTSCAHK